jgi:ketopantoate reductase
MIALERNKVGIVGLGPVGSILGAYLVRSGMKVYGVELSEARAEQVNRDGFLIRGFVELEEKPERTSRSSSSAPRPGLCPICCLSLPTFSGLKKCGSWRR